MTNCLAIVLFESRVEGVVIVNFHLLFPSGQRHQPPSKFVMTSAGKSYTRNFATSLPHKFNQMIGSFNVRIFFRFGHNLSPKPTS
jgi:hypothetical protein